MTKFDDFCSLNMNKKIIYRKMTIRFYAKLLTLKCDETG